MTDTSTRTYIVEGCKISLEALECIAESLPAPASIIVKLVQKIIARVEAVQDNEEQSARLRDRLLMLLAVILAAGTTGRKDEAAFSHNLVRFQRTLEAILEQVKKMTSSSIWHKIGAYVRTSSDSSILRKCGEDLDWAVERFEVAAHLENAVKLCTVDRKVTEVAQDTRAVRTTQALELLPRAKYSGYECERPDRPSKCLEGTRKGLLQRIKDWVITTDPIIPRFFWLKGIAGCGKSTVACTIAEIAHDMGILGGQFFFSRKGEAELRDPALVFPTIAYQLAHFDPEFSRHITAALSADPDAPFAALQQQLERLIINPLSNVQRDSNRVVVIVFDAFDECEARGAKEILKLLVAAMPRLPFYLKIFVTGRPEHHIHSVLTPSADLHITALHDLEKSVVTRDIELYLRDQFNKLREEKCLAKDWVKEHEIELLALKAGCLFIVAATSIRFLLKAMDLERQLELLLRIVCSVREGSEFTNPFASLDTLYMEILREMANETNPAELAMYHQIIVGTIVRLRDPLPVAALERLIGPGSPKASVILDRLHSVILPPAPPDDCPRIYHPSFPDFLLDPTRCTDEKFFIDAKKHEARLALRCLQLVNTNIHKGMLGDLDPGELTSLKDLEDKIRATYQSELQYACRYWASHVAAVTEENAAIVAAVKLFAAKTLLPWVESMSWLGDVYLCLTSLESINTWAVKFIADSETKKLLNDGYRLLLAHFSTVKRSAQHITRSILPFLPRNIHDRLTSQYKEYAEAGITVYQGIESEWPACLMAWEAHPECINAVAFSSDGLRIASASSDSTVSVWDATTGMHVVALKGHTRSVTSVAYSPDRSRLVSGAEDRLGLVWDATTGICLATLRGHSDRVTSVAFSPDNRRIATGSSDSTVRRWDATTGIEINTLTEHTGPVTSVAYSPTGSQLASGSEDETVRLWNDAPDHATGSYTILLSGHSSTVSSVTYSPDGSKLASASYDDTVQVWDTTTGECVAILRGHSDAITSVAFSPDGSRLASGSEDMTVRVWDTQGGSCLSTLEGHSSYVTFVTFSPYGSRLASGSNDRTIRVWDTTESRSLTPRKGHSQTVTSMAFSSDGTRLASGSVDTTVQLWNATTGDHLATLTGHSEGVTSLVFYAGAQLASGSNDKTIRIWDTAEGVCLATRKGHTDSVMSIASAPNGSRLASASKDRIIRIWDTATRNCLTTLRGHSKSVNSVVFAGDGVRLVSGSDDGTVRVWDTSTGVCLGSEDHSTRITCVDLNGLQITACGPGGEIYVQDLPSAIIRPERELGTRTACRYELKDGRLHQIEAAGSTSLVCLIPVFYHVEVSTSFILNEGGARVAFGCHNGEVVILEVAK